MSETSPEVTFDAPVKKKTAKKKAKPRAPRNEKPAVPYHGLTRTACATACNVKACVISHTSHCAHPCKGGLPPDLLSDQAALKRLQVAREHLDIRIDPNRFK